MPRSSEIYDAATQQAKESKAAEEEWALKKKRRKEEKAAEFAKHCKFLEETLKPVLDNLEQNRGISIGKTSFTESTAYGNEYKPRKKEVAIIYDVPIKISHGLKKEIAVLNFRFYLPEALTIGLKISSQGITRDYQIHEIDQIEEDIKKYLARKLTQLMLK
ncbi:MAG: hypothetical protein ABII10_01370 [Candidatus Paceibacterota bacterium]